MTSQSRVNIIKEWDIVAARQLGRTIAKEIGFSSVDQARIATAISELARNIYLYTEEGMICLELIEEGIRKGICVKAEDAGPGIQDISKAMEDGFTTSGGLGAGLPGVKRLMDDFQINSSDKGTTINSIKWLR
ncbi:anti-sigma regulatory factor [Virgibacillus sp. W0181]|uniref:anti-sigma regulatory factor n=1 Tax=Virgibacillus sp. W0181 TaxID=3391581 RepID=UPI003F482073